MFVVMSEIERLAGREGMEGCGPALPAELWMCPSPGRLRLVASRKRCTQSAGRAGKKCHKDVTEL